MRDTQGTAASLDQTLNDALEPVRTHLATIEAEIAARESELADLRKLRTRAASIVRALDPEAPRPGPKANGSKPPQVAVEVVERVREELLARFDPDTDLVAQDLGHDPAFAEAIGAKAGDHTANKVGRAFHILHDDGVIRLDRMGLPGRNRSKVFRLTGGGTNDKT